MLVTLMANVGHSQDTQQLIGQVAEIYAGNAAEDGGFIGDFSLWGLVGGFIFGSIGFIAFVYGKKNAEYRPLLIGIAMMAYPYFFQKTIAIYLIGLGLTAALYFFRE